MPSALTNNVHTASNAYAMPSGKASVQSRSKVPASILQHSRMTNAPCSVNCASSVWHGGSRRYLPTCRRRTTDTCAARSLSTSEASQTFGGTIVDTTSSRPNSNKRFSTSSVKTATTLRIAVTSTTQNKSISHSFCDLTPNRQKTVNILKAALIGIAMRTGI